MLFKGCGAQEGARGLGVDQALKDGADFIFVSETIDFACEYFLGDSGGELYRRQLVGEVRFIGGGQRLNQGLEVFPLSRGWRVAHGSVQHLPNAAPILVQVV